MSEEIVVVVAGGEAPAGRRRARVPARRARDRRRQRPRPRARARARRRRSRSATSTRRHREAVAAAEAAGARIERHPPRRTRPISSSRSTRRSRSTRSASSCSRSVGGRLDHLLSTLLLLGRARYAGVELDADLGAARVHVDPRRADAGRASRASSSRSSPCTARRRASRTEGLAYPLDGETLEPGSSRGVSNVFVGETARVAARARRPRSQSARDGEPVKTRRKSPACCRRSSACSSRLGCGCGRRGRRRTKSSSSRTTRSRSRRTSRRAFERDERPDAPDPAGRRRGRDAHRGAPHRREPAGRRPLRRRQQPSLARARRRPLRAVRVAGARAGRRAVRARPGAPRDADRPRRRVPELRQGLVRGARHRAAAVARRPDRPAVSRSSSSSRTPRPRRPGSRSCSPRSPATASAAGRTSGGGCARTASSSWTAGRRRTTCGSPARREQGDRPIVVSYASSPPAEVIFADAAPERGADGRRRRQLLPPDRVRRRPARSAERGGRARARRLPARRALPGGHPALDVRLPGQLGRRAPPGVREVRRRPREPARAAARGDRREPRPWIDEWTRDRACAERAAAAGARSTYGVSARVPRALLRLPARVDPRARSRLGRRRSRRRSTSSPTR